MGIPPSHGAPSFRGALPRDVGALPPVACRIFTETFESRFGGADFDAFCESVYGLSGTMGRDLTDATIGWRIAEQAGVPIGYAKLRPWTGSPSPSRPGALELQQIYVLSSCAGGVSQKR